MRAKTDWTPDSVYNISDELSRTEQNIHEIYVALEADGNPPLNEKLGWTIRDVLSADQLNRIISNLSACSAAMGINGIPQPPPCWDKDIIDAARINELEVCVQRTYWSASHTPPVMDIDGRLLLVPDQVVVLCVDDGYKAEHTSAYTGEQIDKFVAQIREWNNGEL